MRRCLVVLALAASCGGGAPALPPLAPVNTDPYRAEVAAQVAPLLASQLVDALVVGLVDGERTFVFGFGKVGAGASPDGATVFELGSVSKVFTGILLADAIERGEVAADAAIVSLLPMGITAPGSGERPITLLDLAAHRSGLPSLPPAIEARVHTADPYAGYGEDALLRDLARARLRAAPGRQVHYSNWGYGLLGYLLASRAGAPYAATLMTRVLAPLGLVDTFQQVPAGRAGRHAAGHDALGRVAPFWTFTPAMAGLGGLRSTTNDLLRLTRLLLDAHAAGGGRRGKPAPLAAALRRSLEPLPGADEASAAPEAVAMAMGWQIDGAGRRWHNGSTGGFHAYLGVDLERRHGVVLLAATSTAQVDRLVGPLFELLGGHAPEPLQLPGPDVLARHAGRYALPGSVVEVRVDGKKLVAASPGERPVRLAPISDDEYFIEEVGAVVVFARGEMVFVVGDQRVVATRIGADGPAPAPTPP